ncbi:unnamed protein product, partial [Prorocentrum cordatum]
ASDMSIDMMSQQGAQMGFTLAPRDFNDVYNPVVSEWLDGEREQEGQCINDTLHPISMKMLDLSISTFMDDITKITMLPIGALPEEIAEQMNQDHEAVIAAVFGTSKSDAEMGAARLAPGKRIWAKSTPWAKQFVSDMNDLASTDPDIHAWWHARANDISVFDPSTEEYSMWIRTDPSIMNSAAREWAKSRPEEPEEDMREPEEVEKPFWCDFRGLNEET